LIREARPGTAMKRLTQNARYGAREGDQVIRRLPFDKTEEMRYHHQQMTHHLDISRLTPVERVMLAEELWDSLTADPESLPLTAAQSDELGRRLAAADRGEVTYSSWKDVKRRLFG
jgi:putative addiction module component (TIGR02574 family)